MQLGLGEFLFVFSRSSTGVGVTACCFVEICYCLHCSVCELSAVCLQLEPSDAFYFHYQRDERASERASEKSLRT